jgi:2-polyprenyl-3-methyl-5-hydroxy-6-metoxy-1,4-benzoquinol methylase
MTQASMSHAGTVHETGAADTAKNRWESESLSYATLHPRLEIVLEEVTRLAPSTVLELGCGVGVLRRALARNLPGMRYSGCDVSESAVRVMDDPNVVCVDLNAAEIPFSGQKFDCIVGSGILEYVEDVPALLADVRLRTRVGGWLVASYFNMRHLSRRLQTRFGHTPHRHPAWRNDLTLEQIRRMFREAGFAVKVEIPSSVGLSGSPSIGREFWSARAVRRFGALPLVDVLAHQKVFVCEAVAGS